MSKNSWIIDMMNIDPLTYDLSVKNPNIDSVAELRLPSEILADIKRIDEDVSQILEKLEL